MEKGQGLSSSIAIAVSVFQSVLTALRFCSKLTALGVDNRKLKIPKFPKIWDINSRLKKVRSRNEISANENVRSCMLMSARFLEGKAKRPPLIGYHPPFFVFVCVQRKSVRQEKGLCGSNQRHANQKVESNKSVSSLKIKGIPFRLP